ncbi:MAG: MATE family efflux transporter [Spirochaetes bacterium]|nr:MAG: MATE family efflux transporter [Spirochaetota bacterium]
MNYPKKNARLTEGPVGKTLINLTIPMIFGMVGLIIFNLTDTYFVGKLGADQLAALSFTFPVIFIINSVALGLGIGASVVISRAIGEGDQNKVRRLTTDSLLLAISIVIVFVLAGLATIKPLFTILGASAEIIILIKQYMVIWYIGMPFVVVPMVGNNAIRATGDSKTPSAIMMIAASMNIIMDPLLIFGIGPFPALGIEGAALATVIARFITFSVAIYVLGFREKMLSFKFLSFRKVLASWRAVLFIGAPIAASRMIIPFTAGIITRILSGFGNNVVAGFGVASRIEFFALAAVNSLSAVFGPFIGQNLGAKKSERIHLSIKLSTRFALIWGICLLVILGITAPFIASIFSKDIKVIKTIVTFLRIVPFAYGLNGIFLLSSTALNVLKKPYHSAGLVAVQMFIFYIPLAYLGSKFFGVQGVFLATAAAYILGGISAYLVMIRQIKKIVRW